MKRRINVFRVSTEELVWSGEYDSETTVFTEALVSSGIPDLVETATQSHYIDGEDWVEVRPEWSNQPLLRCRDFEVLQWAAADEEEQRGNAPGEQERTMAKAKAKPKTPSQPPAAKVETLTRELKVQLTPIEVAERADRAARLLEDRDHEEAELKAHASHVKSKIAAMESEMRHLSGEVRTKCTYRDVAVERRYLYETGVVIEVRLDTEEVISERPMTERERQQPLPFGGGELVDNDPFGVEETAAE